jgi:hypothetical protein
MMDIKLAQFLSELLFNVGWVDDTDEILLYMVKECPIEEVRAKAEYIDNLIIQMNEVLPEEERLSIGASQEVDNVVQYLNQEKE